MEGKHSHIIKDGQNQKKQKLSGQQDFQRENFPEKARK